MDDVVSLLVEVTVGSIHHIGRSQTVVDPLRSSPSVSETARVKATTSWRVSSAQSPKYGRCQIRLLANQATSSLGISPNSAHASSAKISTSAKHGIYFLHSNVRHLRARVTVDHCCVSPYSQS